MGSESWGGELSRERLNPWLLTREAEPCLFFWIQKNLPVLEETRQGHPVWQSLSPWKSQNTGGGTLNVRATVQYLPQSFLSDWEMKKGNDLCHIPWWAMEKSDKNMDRWPSPRILRKSHPLSYHIHTNMHTFEALNLQSWERRLDFSSVAKQTSETVFTLREKYRSDASVFIKARR